MKLYTVIFEFLDGTYVSQVECKRFESVTATWLEHLNLDEIDGINEVERDSLRIEFLKEEPVLLEGLKNIWCNSIFWNDRIQFLYIISTDLK